jgi:hypothetical protein
MNAFDKTFHEAISDNLTKLAAEDESLKGNPATVEVMGKLGMAPPPFFAKKDDEKKDEKGEKKDDEKKSKKKDDDDDEEKNAVASSIADDLKAIFK